MKEDCGGPILGPTQRPISRFKGPFCSMFLGASVGGDLELRWASARGLGHVLTRNSHKPPLAAFQSRAFADVFDFAAVLGVGILVLWSLHALLQDGSICFCRSARHICRRQLFRRLRPALKFKSVFFLKGKLDMKQNPKSTETDPSSG